jgi:hypothetical protein
MVDADPEAWSEDRLTMRRALLALMIFVCCCGSLAEAQAPAPPSAESPAPSATPSDDARLDLQKPEEDTPKAAESWWQKVLRDAPNCKSFTDGCRTCSPTVCSNIGIACQPKDWSCNDANTGASPGTEPEAKPEIKPDAKPESKQ